MITRTHRKRYFHLAVCTTLIVPNDWTSLETQSCSIDRSLKRWLEVYKKDNVQMSRNSYIPVVILAEIYKLINS